METNKIYNGDCIEVMKTMTESSIDLIVTSPPYGVGIAYDTHNDDVPFSEYKEFSKSWLTEAYRVLKDDGRIALNIPYEINVRERGGRIFLVSEYWQMMKEIGFGFFGVVDLEEDSPHRSKTTAWGSWMSPSSPYIYNPKECVILAYKKDYKKKEKGISQWSYNEVEMENEEGVIKNKRVYSEKDKSEFMELVFGQWKYFNDTKSLTKATFSMDIPMKAIKILSYKNDLVVDCFSGSGTTALAAKKLDRNYIGFELSENYAKISQQRLIVYDNQKKQLLLFEEEN
jgi:site-specific DNA-methyltransferase (adenine-specific)